MQLSTSEIIGRLEVMSLDENLPEADRTFLKFARDRLHNTQMSLRSEVDRIEKLQPFFNEVSAAVDAARNS